MSNFLKNALLFAAIIACSIAITFGVISIAYAGLPPYYCAATDSPDGTYSAGDSVNPEITQPFTVDADCLMYSLYLNVYVFEGTPASPPGVEIWKDAPDGEMIGCWFRPVEDYPLVSGESLAFGSEEYDCSGDSTILLETGTQYYLVFNPQGIDDSNYFGWESAEDDIPYGAALGFGESTIFQLLGNPVEEEPTMSEIVATSSIDQTQENFTNSFYIFISGVVFAVWFFRKNYS